MSVEGGVGGVSGGGRPRVVFMGTPELARTVLVGLVGDDRWEVVLVVAQPDKPVGRGMQVQAPPVKAEAQARGLPVAQPAKARDPEFLTRLRALSPDVVVVAAYGQLLPPELLSIPRAGCLNVHTSLLPRWRGAAPIQWAIAEGDEETGVTLMRMDVGLDTGDIVAVVRTPILETDTSAVLHDRLAGLGARLVVETLPGWLAGEVVARPQPAEGVRLARKLSREDGALEWRLPAEVLARRVRAFSPWPGAYTLVEGGEGGTSSWVLKVWDAVVERGASEQPAGQVLAASGDDWVVAAGAGALRLRTVQREGRRRMTAREFLAGGGIRVGDRLGVAGSTG